MNKEQILILVAIIAAIFFFINLKFDLQRFTSASSAIELQTNLNARRGTTSTRMPGGIFSAKALFIASVICAVVAAIPFFISINLFNTWFRTYNLASSSPNWSQVKGSLVRTGSKRTKSLDHRSSLSYSSDSVAYEYTYNDKKYTGSTISYDNGWAMLSGTSYEKSLLRKLPKSGEDLVVYFNEHTGHSVLFPGTQYTNYWAVILVTPFFLFAVVASYFSFAFGMKALAIRT